jgi:excisionase family DNA binding protein
MNDERSESRATTAPNSSGLPAVLTPDDLATLLRMRKRAVLDAILRGELPGVRRVGRRIRADRDTILRWLADGRGEGGGAAVR